MKNRFLSGMAILTFAIASSFTMGAWAQTTDEGSGPSEQPSAPMEMGQPQAPEQAPPPGQMQGQYQGGGPNAQGGPDSAEAQPGGPSGEAPAKVDQGVARISMMHGDVSTQRGDSGTWSAATLNQPVMGGDKVSTAPGARAEVQLDFANILRLGTDSQVNISNFTHHNIQIQLAKGLATYTVSKNSEAEPEIDTPNVSVHPAHHDGIFRIEVQPDGDTLVIVRKGEAQIATPQGSAEVHEGEMATVRGGTADAQYKISTAPERDDWDHWNADRDRIIQNAQSWHHTNHYYTGSEDLDAYGRWQNVPDYGQVWTPNEPEGWTPYRDGNWVYEPYYGWTWVGYEPWGWAPYHYGRWMYYGNSWAWWPGPVWGAGFYRPFWAPAYVSFFGWGGGFGFGVGFGWGGWGGFGWLPLGPCDWFHPWWGGYGGRFGFAGWRGGGFDRFGGFSPLHGGTRFSNVGRLGDPHIGGALSTVSAGRFGAGRVSAVAATHEQIGGARMATGNLPVVPSHASLSASGRAAAPSTIHSGASDHFFSNTRSSTASAASHASFSQETSHLQQSMQQSHVSSVQAGGRMNEGGMNEARSSTTAGAKPSAGTPMANRDSGNAGSRSLGGQSASGNRSFTPPNSSNARSSASETSRGNTNSSANGGFRSFTPPSHSEASGNGSSRGESSLGGTSRGESMSRSSGSSGSYWSRTAPSSSGSRSAGSSSYGSSTSGSRSAESGGRSYSDAYGRGGSSRPQLDMRQNIVQPRSSGSYGGSYGGYRGSPSYGGGSYGGSRGSYSGSHGSYSGSHSTPNYGGGSHSSGGHSSGGGHASSGHSGGGGHGGGGHR